MPKYASMQERILANSKVDESSPLVHGKHCRLWTGKTRTSNRGNKYPALTKRISKGPRKGKVANITVTRLVIMVFKNRRMTRRMVARHLCIGNSLCIEETHLIGGTQKRNVHDTVEQGRHRNMYS